MDLQKQPTSQDTIPSADKPVQTMKKSYNSGAPPRLVELKYKQGGVNSLSRSTTDKIDIVNQTHT